MLSDTPHSEFSPRARSSNSGFTLIELLMVIAVIAILAGITLGISTGVKNAQNRAVAKAQLATLSQAIEQFKLRYGDYPWHLAGETDNNKMLLYALTGRLVMERDTGGTLQVITEDSQSNAVVEKRPKFIDDTKFYVKEDSSGNSIELLDPWGNPYVYWYKWSDNPGKWEIFGYHLYSTGAHNDREEADAANEALKGKMEGDDAAGYTGVFDDDYRDVADEHGIIFAGE